MGNHRLAPGAGEVLLAKMMESQLFDPMTGKRDEARATEDPEIRVQGISAPIDPRCNPRG